jgi:biofilm protein TabA
MIFDQVENWQEYPFGKVWKQAFDFITSLTPDAEVKRYPLIGDDLFAIVNGYETRYPDDAKLEAHRVHFDIQCMLSGKEIIEWYPTNQLQTKVEYDKTKDVQFYHELPECPVTMILQPGMFSFFKPGDAHKPEIMLGAAPEKAKKVVIKINKKLLEI